MTRTVSKYTRIWGNGYSLCGYTQSIGPLTTQFDAPQLTTLCDTVHGVLPNHPMISPGTLQGVFDNTASGLHALANGGGSAWDLIVSNGMLAEPTMGSPAFVTKSWQSAYQAQDSGGAMTCTVPFDAWDASDLINYSTAWGWILNNGTQTGVNSATGHDAPTAAATTTGGYMAYQLLSSDGSVTISVEDSANNSAWAAVSGMTSGVIAAAPAAGIVAIGTTATIRRYTRWQITLGTASTVNFVLALVRGI